MKKFIKNIKNKVLFNTIQTIILFAIIVLAYIGINMWVNKMNFTDIDVTKEQIYTVSEESLQKISGINEEVRIYFFGYLEDSSVVDLAKQYEKRNNNIKVEVVDLEKRQDLVSKYQVESTDVAIVVESDKGEKILSENDLYSYDYTSYEQIDLTEQKLTNAILLVTKEKQPTLYFLEGHSEYNLKSHLNYLNAYLVNDVNKVESLNLLITPEIPEDCSILIINSPQKDFTDLETQEILNYINNGGDIIWLNDSSFSSEELKNINRILDEYGISFDNNGVNFEEDQNKMLMQTPNYIIPDISYTDFTEEIMTDGGLALLNSGKINFKNDDELERLGIDVQNFISSSETSFYRRNLNQTSYNKTEEDQSGPNVIASMLTKSVSEDKQSKLIAFANNIFITDYMVNIGNQSIPAISLLNNKDIVLNVVAYLTDNQDEITIRKETGVVTYTATQMQDNIIKCIIFGFPIIIIIVGIIVWQKRRRKK